jgi:hypothetical protein
MTQYPPLILIYQNQTPEELTYPNNIEVNWKELENGFIRIIKNKLSKMDIPKYEGVCHVATGDLDCSDPNFSFEVFLMQSISIPYSYDARSYPAGYKLLLTSDDMKEWGDFVSKMTSIDRSQNWSNALHEHTKSSKVWPNLIEEQYMVCALRALRKTFNINSKNIYCGFDGDTAEDWVDRRKSIISV